MKDIKQRLIGIFRKLGLNYSKKDYTRAGIKIKQQKKRNILTDFSVPISPDNYLQYVLRKKPEKTKIEKPPDRNITLYLVEKPKNKTIPLISEEFTNSKGEIVIPPSTPQVYWENPQPRHSNLSPREIISKLSINKVLDQLEHLYNKVEKQKRIN